MRILQVAPTYVTTPPRKYGGIETVIAELTTGLTSMGHELTVYAAAGSQFTDSHIKMHHVTPYPTSEQPLSRRKWEISQLLEVLRDQHSFDLIHFHIEPKYASLEIESYLFDFLNYFAKPLVVTMHNTTHITEHIDFYRQNPTLHKYHYIFISKDQQKALNFLPNAEVIYHGIDTNIFVPKPNFQHADYLLFLGRISDIKGTAEAIAVAKQANKKLIIAGNVDYVDKIYFERRIKPQLKPGQVEYVGEVDIAQKLPLYQNALATLFPIKWHEPFGLVMIESLACGTPVIALNAGSVPEIIDHGKTGFIVDHVADMIHSVKKLDQIARAECRTQAEERFGLERMLQNYIAYYTKVITDAGGRS